MPRRVNVLMPTLGRLGTRAEDALREHAPFDVNLIQSGVPGWSAAINDCLAQRERGEDCLIIDDDVFVGPETFNPLWDHYADADVFGFLLRYPTGEIQHDGGYVTPDMVAGHIRDGREGEPSFVRYVTASLCYVKADVFERIPRLVQWPGVQWEDVALCVDAWAQGFKVMYLPGEAVHEETATKRFDPNLNQRFAQNGAHFHDLYKGKVARLDQRFGGERRLRTAPVLQQVAR